MTENNKPTQKVTEHLNLQEIIDNLQLQVLTDALDFHHIYPSSAYASDLLSCVMTGARHAGVWITLQAHSNIVAVAALLELSVVIITENANPEPEVIENARQQGVCLVLTSLTNYEVAGRLWAMGLPG